MRDGAFESICHRLAYHPCFIPDIFDTPVTARPVGYRTGGQIKRWINNAYGNACAQGRRTNDL